MERDALPGGVDSNLDARRLRANESPRAACLGESQYEPGQEPGHPGYLQSIAPRMTGLFRFVRAGGRELPCSTGPEGRDLRVTPAVFTTMWTESVCRKREGVRSSYFSTVSFSF